MAEGVLDLEALLAPLGSGDGVGEDIREDYSPTSVYQRIRTQRNDARAGERMMDGGDPEANPATIRPEKARRMRELGVTRLSLGVQSWDDELLKTLGRVHNAEEAEQTFHVLRDAGFANLNIDLMFAVPGQSEDQWQATLAKTIALQPDHISTYCLTYEEDTEYFRKLGIGARTCPSPGRSAAVRLGPGSATTRS